MADAPMTRRENTARTPPAGTTRFSENAPILQIPKRGDWSMLFLIWKLLRKRKKKPAPEKEVVEAQRPPAPRKGRPEWEAVLTASLEQNCLAPSEDVILHAFDLYRDELYGPFMERRRQSADTFAEIVADVASLQALVPDLIERAMARHPFEFSRLIDMEKQ
jgi:hypothetical protein